MNLVLAAALAGAVAVTAAGPAPELLVLDPGDHGGNDVSAAEQAATRAAIERYRELFGELPPPGWAAFDGANASRLPQRYTFLPFGGVYNDEIWGHAFVDLAPETDFLDFNCTGYTYDGHTGQDYLIRGFGEQDVGVPFFAALSGRVVEVVDNLPDREIYCRPVPGNHIVVDHGGGQYGHYWHLRRGSARVAEGERVEAGQELGKIASSGCSDWPHLHFETRVDFAVVEPSSGACNPGPSGWVKQKPLMQRTRLFDAGFSHINPMELDRSRLPPHSLPRSGQIGRRDATLYLWFYVLNLPPSSSYQIEARGPDGSLGFDSGVRELGNPSLLRIAVVNPRIEMEHLRDQLGTWDVTIRLNGKKMLTAPVEVRQRRKKKFNRPPVTPKKVVLSPRRPRAASPVVCTAKGSALLDDPDYDIVRFFYQWRAGDRVLRETTTAVRTDVLAANSAAAGETLTCTVVATDGKLAAEARSRSARLR